MESIKLQNGSKMPLVGLGTWLMDKEEDLTEAMETALELGYRHFDTAYIYANEVIIGKVLKRWFEAGKVTREELFIVTKLPIHGMSREKVGHYLGKSLENLQLDYVDLYLIHVPFGLDSSNSENIDSIPIENGQVVIDKSLNLEDVWGAMEDQVGIGKAKSIGISNFEGSQIERIVKVAKIQPANLQIELHAYFQQKSLRAICAKYGISVCAFSPLGSGGRKDFYAACGLKFEPTSMLTDPVVVNIAKKYGKTPAQIFLRFITQQGIIVIPKSNQKQRIQENFQILDFKLKPEDMKNLETLDKGAAGRTMTFAFLPGIENHPEYPKSMLDGRV